MAEKKPFRHYNVREFRGHYPRFELKFFIKYGGTFYSASKEQERNIMLNGTQWRVLIYHKMTSKKLAVCVEEIKDEKN